MTDIDWNSIIPRDVKKNIAIVFSVIGVFCAAEWALFIFAYSRGKDIGQDELSTYKAVNAEKLPEITSRLISVDKSLRESLNVFEKNKSLEMQNISYKKQIADVSLLKDKMNIEIKNKDLDIYNYKKTIEELKKKILSLSGESRDFTVKSDKTEYLGEKHFLGVVDSIGSHELKVVIDNKNYEISVGSSVPVSFSDKNCNITLLSLQWPDVSGDFHLSCNNK